uniref:Activin_recp domain-containing protein n=1 Tax=Elaeophora elaphi TaxID=1147741 RepID=A0A0R3RHC3_9BILA
MVDTTHATFIILLTFVISATIAIKCQIYFRKGRSPPKTNGTEDCESSSCCFTAQLHHNRRVFQIKGCDADDVQDNMQIYVPSLTGKPWENIMEACLVASECRVHNDLLGGKGESYLCGCDSDFCNVKSFQDIFPQLKNEPHNHKIFQASTSNDNLSWIVSASATSRSSWGLISPKVNRKQDSIC